MTKKTEFEQQRDEVLAKYPEIATLVEAGSAIIVPADEWRDLEEFVEYYEERERILNHVTPECDNGGCDDCFILAMDEELNAEFYRRQTKN